ncbi:recombinase family protein [Chloroflexota bacterium]
MVVQNVLTERKKSAITEEEFDALIDLVASKPEFNDWFGVRGCDLLHNNWWAAYIRQSLEEQSRNNRLAEYLLTCAHEAKRLGVIVPREYILYDTVSGEHLERPSMVYLRQQLLPEHKIAGIILPALDRLSREPIHIGIFEFEAEYVRVRVHYADAPNGSDPMSQMVRMNITSAAKFVKLANKKNNRGGNKGRVTSGNVPAGKPAYGYTYRAKYEDLAHGRRCLIRAWWEINELDAQENPIWGTEAWVVDQVYYWIGIENHSPYWVAKELNKLGIKPRYASYWSPSLVEFIIRKRCYTGNHAYNTAHYVPNPERPLGDITGEIKRTIRKPKPKEEHVSFQVPSLVSDELWERANQNLDVRKGTREKRHVIEALFRHRLYCPKCGKVMTVRRYADATKYPHFVYYACPGNCQSWKPGRCNMTAGRIDRVDNSVKRKLEKALKNPDWAMMQSSRHTEEKEITGIKRQIRLLDFQISQAESGIAKIQQAYENDSPLYTGDEATRRIAEYRDKSLKATQSKEELETSLSQIAHDKVQSKRTKEAFQKIHIENIKRSTFADWLRIVEILDVKVYPSEDWGEITVTTAIDLAGLDSDRKPSLCYNTNIASPKL